MRHKVNVLGIFVDCFTTVRDAAETMLDRAESASTPGYVCLSNVHMFVEALDQPDFKEVLRDAAYVVPDGKPIAMLASKAAGGRIAHLRGYDLTMELLRVGSERGLRFGFYGSTDEVLSKLQSKVQRMLPKSQVEYKFSPPFFQIQEAEMRDVIAEINRCNLDVLFVGLGCPKQEKWMNSYYRETNCLLVGVGAVFDFLAEKKAMAPRFISLIGLEWLLRLITEPRRLSGRYFKTNSKFVFYWLTNKLKIRDNTIS